MTGLSSAFYWTRFHLRKRLCSVFGTRGPEILNRDPRFSTDTELQLANLCCHTAKLSHIMGVFKGYSPKVLYISSLFGEFHSIIDTGGKKNLRNEWGFNKLLEE